MAYAHASFLIFVGPVGQATVYVDQVTSQQGMPEHYQTLLEEYTSWERVRSVFERANAPLSFIKLHERAIPKQWKVNLNAKGPFAQLADFTCAMFGRFIDDEIREPWEIVRLRYTKGESKIYPPCMGSDITWAVRVCLKELFFQGNQKYVFEKPIDEKKGA